jgi:heterodisulfide reductase subunit A
MADVGSHPNITLMTWSEVEQVEGYTGNFTVTVRKKARFINEDSCTGCGICWEKCPKKVVDEVFEVGLAYRTAVYRPFPQAVPKYPVIDKENCTYFINGKCKACQLFCPTSPNSIDFEQEDEIVQIEVGDIVLATGFDLFDARKIPQYGYGRLENVFTNLEFERLCNAAGPTNGAIVLRDGVTVPESVGIIHCVGSRDKNYHNYCSAVCCMASLKFAHLVKERTGAEVYNFYIDMRTTDKGYDEFYQHVMEEGAHMIRGKVAEVTDAAPPPGLEGKLFVQVEDTLIGKQRRIPVDMVVLASGFESRHDAKEVAKKFGISCSSDDWFIEKHPKLDPVATMTDGIFIAGAAQGPKDIPSSVAQGAAAAARIIGRIQQGEIAMEPIRASVIAEKCSGCRICNALCPYNAIIWKADENVTEINPALCQGCGTCVAACPSDAITGTGFSDEQVLAQIEGILSVKMNGAQPAMEVKIAEPVGG